MRLPATSTPLLLAALAPIAAPLAHAQEGPPIGMTAQDAVPVVSIKMGDLGDTLVSPKDGDLRRAFAMIPARLAELPRELGGEMPPPAQELFSQQSMPVWLHLLRAPKTVSVGLSATQAVSADNPLVFGVRVHEDSEEQAQAFANDLGGLLQRMQAPVPPGAYAVEGAGITSRLGMAPVEDFATKARGMVGDGALVMEMNMDVGGAVGFARQMMETEGAPPEAMMMMGIVERLGLNELQLEVAQVVTPEHLKTASVMTGVGGRLRAAGILPEGGVGAAHLGPIPADATMANVSRVDMGAMFDALNGLATDVMSDMGMAGSDPAEQLMQVTGIDLRDGLFNALGDTMGYYSSHTTGGGGLTSTVMFASIRDYDALVDTKEQIEGMFNGLTASQTRGYVSIRAWDRGDAEYTTLMFPGLPVPLEPTIAMTEEWLVVAATPNAAIAAMGQIAGGGESLATHPGIAPLLDGSKSGISFLDAQFFAEEGYGTVSVLSSAIVNAMRSPTDATRDPGPIVPLYTEFCQGIAPTIGYSEVRGDDLVSMATGDSSNLVQMAMLSGFVQEFLIGLVIPIGIGASAEQIEREFF